MNGYDILKSLNHVDEKHLYDNETTKEKSKLKVFIPIMSAAMLLGVVFLTPYPPQSREDNVLGQIPDSEGNVVVSEEVEYALIFNDDGARQLATADIAAPGFSFSEEITKEQFKKLFPILANEYELEGRMIYYHLDGSTEIHVFQNCVLFSTISNSEEKNVVITFAEDRVVNCMVTPREEDKTTIINDVEVLSYKSNYEKSYYFASFKIDNIAYEVEFKSEVEADEQFTDIVVDIILGGKADWSTFNPEIPEKAIVDE